MEIISNNDPFVDCKSMVLANNRLAAKTGILKLILNYVLNTFLILYPNA